MLTVAQKSARKFAKETPLGRTRRARKIHRILAETYPNARCELDFRTPFELLVATVLSAQTTDIRVNQVTPNLFAHYPDAHALAQADLLHVEELVHSTGFYRAKARNIVRLAQELVERFDGEVPGNMKDLVSLPGTGRKTANVVLGNAFGVPGLTVDTHLGRLARRFGFTSEEDPLKVEADVVALFPRKDLTMLSHRMIFHGRRICHSRKPACGACPIAALCPSFGVGEVDPVKATAMLRYEMAPKVGDTFAGKSAPSVPVDAALMPSAPQSPRPTTSPRRPDTPGTTPAPTSTAAPATPAANPASTTPEATGDAAS
ncbi:endonuclease III [Brevibacterium samyangense]|uniref:Endonuclease III n=1 Tax=Brevibacterium samyangense TaxID=366888 RepID=A0ABP5ELM8_9MICO